MRSRPTSSLWRASPRSSSGLEQRHIRQFGRRLRREPGRRRVNVGLWIPGCGRGHSCLWLRDHRNWRHGVDSRRQGEFRCRPERARRCQLGDRQRGRLAVQSEVDVRPQKSRGSGTRGLVRHPERPGLTCHSYRRGPDAIFHVLCCCRSNFNCGRDTGCAAGCSHNAEQTGNGQACGSCDHSDDGHNDEDDSCYSQAGGPEADSAAHSEQLGDSTPAPEGASS